MYDDQIIEKLIKKVCDKFGLRKHFYLNGERAEGYSLIAKSSVQPEVMETLINYFNETFPDAPPLVGWWETKGKDRMIYNNVPKKYHASCMEVRLYFKDFDPLINNPGFNQLINSLCHDKCLVFN